MAVNNLDLKPSAAQPEAQQAFFSGIGVAVPQGKV
jgi:hypothetical protein